MVGYALRLWEIALQPYVVSRGLPQEQLTLDLQLAKLAQMLIACNMFIEHLLVFFALFVDIVVVVVKLLKDTLCVVAIGWRFLC